MKPAAVVALLLTAACTGSFVGGTSDGGIAAWGGGGGSSSGSSSASSSGGSSDAGEPDLDAAPGEGAVASSDGAAVFADASAPCQTNVDSYGFTRCTCAPGVAALGNAAVSSCSGYDCCVAYAADSGLAVGFGDPALTAGLCACFHADDIAAILGTTATCNELARDGVGKVVKACP